MTYLAKQVNFQFERWIPISWSSSRGKHCSIVIDVCPPDRLHFRYTTTSGSTGEKRNSDYYVYIVSTPCNYGGQRWWFRCPACNRRCRILYLAPGSVYFACRICHDLTYTSQQEGRNRWSPLFDAMTKFPELERQYMRTRSGKKRNRLERKMGDLYREFQVAYNLSKRRRRRKKWFQ